MSENSVNEPITADDPLTIAVQRLMVLMQESEGFSSLRDRLVRITSDDAGADGFEVAGPKLAELALSLLIESGAKGTDARLGTEYVLQARADKNNLELLRAPYTKVDLKIESRDDEEPFSSMMLATKLIVDLCYPRGQGETRLTLALYSGGFTVQVQDGDTMQCRNISIQKHQWKDYALRPVDITPVEGEPLPAEQAWMQPAMALFDAQVQLLLIPDDDQVGAIGQTRHTGLQEVITEMVRWASSNPSQENNQPFEMLANTFWGLMMPALQLLDPNGRLAESTVYRRYREFHGKHDQTFFKALSLNVIFFQHEGQAVLSHNGNEMALDIEFEGRLYHIQGALHRGGGWMNVGEFTRNGQLREYVGRPVLVTLGTTFEED